MLGSRAIVRELEARAPDPPLLPADPDLRARAERAEEWGDQVLQPLVRRILWAAIRRAPQATESYTEGARLPVPRPVARLSAPLVARMAQAANGAGDIAVRADLRALPGPPGPRSTRWLADGTLGGAVLHAGDLQVAASLRLLSTVGDVAGALDERARPARWRCAPSRTTPAPCRPGRCRRPGCPTRLAPLARPHGERHGADAREALAVAGRREQLHADPAAPPHRPRARPGRAAGARSARGRRAARSAALASTAGPARRRSAPKSVTTPVQRPTVASAQATRTGTRPRRSSRARPASTSRPGNGFGAGTPADRAGRRARGRDGEPEVVEVRVVVACRRPAPRRASSVTSDRARQRRHGVAPRARRAARSRSPRAAAVRRRQLRRRRAAGRPARGTWRAGRRGPRRRGSRRAARRARRSPCRGRSRARAPRPSTRWAALPAALGPPAKNTSPAASAPPVAAVGSAKAP